MYENRKQKIKIRRQEKVYNLNILHECFDALIEISFIQLRSYELVNICWIITEYVFPKYSACRFLFGAEFCCFMSKISCVQVEVYHQKCSKIMKITSV